jgi:glycine hydroxymethyltransferase
VIAAKTVCLGEALTADYRVYAQSVVDNARALAARLSRHGIDLVSGGTDTHLVLLDLRNRDISGQQAQDRLFDVNITSNKNPVPFDSGNPSRWVGLRLGVAAATTRGLGTEEFADIADIINTLLVAGDPVNSSLLEGAKMRIAELCTQFPVDADL